MNVRGEYARRVRERGRGRFRPISNDGKDRSSSPKRQTHSPEHPRRSLRSPERSDIFSQLAPNQRKNDSTWGVRQMFSLLKRFVYGKYLKAGMALLDLGHGPGTDLSKFAHARISSLTAIDFVQEQLDEAEFRASHNARFRRNVREARFIQQDLSKVVCRLDPPVDVVTCQFALHYLWSDEHAIATIMTTIRDSLRSKGHLIITIVDDIKLPLAQGITQHPFIRITWPNLKINPPTHPSSETKIVSDDSEKKCEMKSEKKSDLGSWYEFTFAGLVTNVREYVIRRDDLIKICLQYSLQIVSTFTVREQYTELRKINSAQPNLTENDWQAIDLYRSYVFQKI